MEAGDHSQEEPLAYFKTAKGQGPQGGWLKHVTWDAICLWDEHPFVRNCDGIVMFTRVPYF